jgi:hypothetical protein
MTDGEARVETRTDTNDIDEAALGAYLRHHVAGSEVAEKMARSLLERELDPEVRSFLERFTDALGSERAIVMTALDQLSEGPGLIERGLGMATGVATMVKDAVPGGAPSDLEGLEALAVGVWGKRLLWGTLKTLATVHDGFRALPLDDLSEQAENQERELVRLRQRSIAASVMRRPDRD